MKKVPHILVVNSLDERYGSTYRIRAFQNLIAQMGYSVRYEEQLGNAWKKLFFSLRASLGSYDLLLTQKFNPITLAAILIARIRRKPVIVDWDDFDEGLQNSGLKKCLIRFCETVGPKFSTAITTHSEEIFLKAQSFCPTHLVPQGFEEELFQPEGIDREKVRRKRDFYLKNFVVGYLCTFTHGGILDLETILKIWGKIKNPNIRFFLIGGGPLEKKVHALVHKHGLSNRVQMSGLLSHEKIPEALLCLDLGMIFMKDIPANRARVSFKVIEYLAMNIPVMGQVVGATQRKFGKLIIPATEKDFVSKIEMFEQHPIQNPFRAQMVKYSWNSISLTLQRVLSEILVLPSW